MPDDDKKIVSRREFARGAVLAAASAAVLGGRSVAQSEGAKAPTSAAPAAIESTKTESANPPSKPLSPDDRAEVEARMSAILRKHGSRLSNEQKNDIQRLLREGQPSLAEFRAFPLQNSDEPATVLHVVVEKGSEHA